MLSPLLFKPIMCVYLRTSVLSSRKDHPSRDRSQDLTPLEAVKLRLLFHSHAAELLM